MKRIRLLLLLVGVAGLVGCAALTGPCNCTWNGIDPATGEAALAQRRAALSATPAPGRRPAVTDDRGLLSASVRLD